MDKGEVQGLVDRLRREFPRHELIGKVCLALERYLVGDRRGGKFDKRVYMREYMRVWRRGRK
jgi:hypothetical protein